MEADPGHSAPEFQVKKTKMAFEQTYVNIATKIGRYTINIVYKNRPFNLQINCDFSTTTTMRAKNIYSIEMTYKGTTHNPSNIVSGNVLQVISPELIDTIGAYSIFLTFKNSNGSETITTQVNGVVEEELVTGQASRVTAKPLNLKDHRIIGSP